LEICCFQLEIAISRCQIRSGRIAVGDLLDLGQIIRVALDAELLVCLRGYSFPRS